jgi:HNH endonuclease/AP2 domain
MERMTDAPLTILELREAFDYEPLTGRFTWKMRPSTRVKVGDRAGCVKSDGYRVIRFKKRRYFAHELAWLWVTGRWPEREISHWNLVRDDDRWANLRAACRSENQLNSQKHRNNTSGFKGVSLHRPTGRYQARLNVGGKQRHLGLYDSAEEAHEAYSAANRNTVARIRATWSK